jgi:hypothetical protein
VILTPDADAKSAAPSEYYRLLPDAAVGARSLRWPETADGTPLMAGTFVSGREYGGSEPVRVASALGSELPDVLFGFQAMPIVATPLAEAIQRVAPHDVQLVRTVIGASDERFRIINITRMLDCIDERTSQVQIATVEDIRTGRAYGRYRAVSRIRVRAKAAHGAHLFRLLHWPVALIASREVVALLEAAHATGVRWEPV